MGIKRVVDMDFWTDDKVIENFSPEDKLFFLYLLTNPHSSMLGVYKISPKQMAFELGYSPEAVSVLLDRFENKYEMIKYSSATREIAIKNYLRFGIVAGGKPVMDRLCASMKEVKEISLLHFVLESVENRPPENSTVQNFVDILKEYVNENDNGNGDGDGESYHESHDESYHESPPNRSITVQQVVDMYHSICKSYRKVRSLSEARKKTVRARLKAYSLIEFEMVFKNAEASDFLKGKNDRKWKANFDWMMKDANFAKILDGNYEKEEPAKEQGGYYNFKPGEDPLEGLF